MRIFIASTKLQSLTPIIALLTLIIACSQLKEETIAGVTVPVPKSMTRNTEKPVELSLLGFGAGQATFQGNIDTEKIVDFYKKEMPARGWQTNMNLRSGGAVLAYSKEGKTLFIGVGQQDGKTNLTLTVGGLAR